MASRKIGIVKPKKFLYTMPDDELIDKVNQERPINLYNFNQIIDNIHKKYPMMQKSDIRAVVHSIIESMRELILKGYSLHMSDLFKSFKMLYTKVKKTKTSKHYIALKATPTKSIRRLGKKK